MTTIQNYDSRAKLCDYKIDTVYAFYLSRANMKNLVKMNAQDTKKHAKALKAAIDAYPELACSSGKYLNFTRAIGVVVEHHKASEPHDVDQISVMFQTENNSYVLRRYAVNTHDVFTNEKNYVLPAAVIRVTAA